MGELSPTNWQWLNKHTWIVKEMLSHTNSNNRCKMHGMKWPMHNWNQQTKMSSWNVMIFRFCGFEGRKLISCCAQNTYQIYHTTKQMPTRHTHYRHIHTTDTYTPAGITEKQWPAVGTISHKKAFQMTKIGINEQKRQFLWISFY